MGLTEPAHPLIGAWQLLSWRIRYADGRPDSYPFGRHASGKLMYSADGRMLAAISMADRTPLSTAVPRQAPDAEQVAAFNSFFCYGGDYEIDGDDVIHRVDISLNPNFVGSEQRRHMQFAGDTLTLSASEGKGEAQRHHELCWRKVIPRDTRQKIAGN